MHSISPRQDEHLKEEECVSEDLITTATGSTVQVTRRGITHVVLFSSDNLLVEYSNGCAKDSRRAQHGATPRTHAYHHSLLNNVHEKVVTH